MKVHYRSRLARLFLPKRYIAVTLASHVLTRESSLDDGILRHEWVHVEQWRRHGLIGFLARYVWYHFMYGYEHNPFEVEARKAEAVSLPETVDRLSGDRDENDEARSATATRSNR